MKQFWPLGVQWLSGRVLDSRLRGRGFEPLFGPIYNCCGLLNKMVGHVLLFGLSCPVYSLEYSIFEIQHYQVKF